MARNIARARRAATDVRPASGRQAAKAAPPPWSRTARLAPWIAGALALAGALLALVPGGRTRGFDVDAFARLPVLEGGRVKPVDSVARNALLVLSGRQALRHDGRRVEADEWLLDVLFRPQVADDEPVFTVDDPEVLGLMGMSRTSERRVSVRSLLPHFAELDRQSSAASAVEGKLRTRFQAAIVNLHDRVALYHRLRNTMQPARSRGLAAEIALAQRPGAAERHAAIARLAFFRALPPAPGQGSDAFASVGEALAAPDGPSNQVLWAWAQVSSAWASQDATAFNLAVAELGRLAASQAPAAARHGAWEAAFNRAQPFYTGMVIYVLALLAACASWLWWARLLRPLSFGLLAGGALVHTAGLAARILLQGRPPVTNLYSSAVFVGWAVVVGGLLLERIYRRGFGVAVSAAVGFASLLVAHHLDASGDTMEMMRAVLDSNFWLATHVVAITIGYSGTFLAGFLGIAWALRRHLATQPESDARDPLASSIYGVLCFSLLFSFLGTVLGGIWADQSWGRFWGWDPKENGALLIVLWNAVILHSRLGGFVRARGLAAMAIFGNVITSLSWFGVNMLGIGLHSYGFMEGAFRTLFAFVAVQLGLVAVALAPVRFRLANGSPARRRGAHAQGAAGSGP